MSNIVDVYIGAETGVLKGISLIENSFQNFNDVRTLDRSQEIVSISWINNTNDGGDETEILCALLNKQLKLYDSVSSTFTNLFTVDGGSGKICGLEISNDKIVTCVESGLVKLWRLDGTDEKVDIFSGSNACRMRKSPTKSNLFATCGKENPLKVWDLENSSAPIFTAKNVKNNWLEIRTPIWDTDLRFFNDESSNLIATCTKNHFIRLYDLRGPGRRPVVQIDWQEDPFTAMTLCNREKQVVAGTNRGFMGVFDFRAPGKLLRSFKGAAGNISSIEAHPTLPYVASCGLDRFFRLHEFENKKLLHKVYCKSHLNALLMKKNLSIVRKIKEELLPTEEKSTTNFNEDEDEFWSDMTKIGEKRKRKIENNNCETDFTPQTKLICEKSLKKRPLLVEDENRTNDELLGRKNNNKSKKKRLDSMKKRKNSSDSDVECISGLKSKLKNKKLKLKSFKRKSNADSPKLKKKRVKSLG